MADPTDSNIRLIDSHEELQAICKRLQKQKKIAFDTEFIRETTFFPKLEVLQVADDQNAYVFDMAALLKRPEEDLKPLKDLFLNPKITKIVHAAFGDQECLWSSLGVLATPIFDTAVGASLLGLGDNIGLANLLKEILRVEHPKSYTRTNWSKRPLPKPVIEYALQDVRDLVRLSDQLFEKLNAVGRLDWAMNLSAKFSDQNLYDVPTLDLAKKIAQSGRFSSKDFGVLIHLVEWREKRVRELNVPRRWLAEDSVLLDLAKIKPKTIEELTHFRGLSKGEHKPKAAEKILKAIQSGLDYQGEIPTLVKNKRELQPSSEESRVMELLRTAIGVLADDQKVASKHFVAPNHLLPLIRLKAPDLKTLRESGYISEQLPDGAAKRLLDFLQGKVALSFQSGKVQLVTLKVADEKAAE